MSLPRLRLERCSCNNGIWTIDAEEAHHLVRVRHCYTGSLVEGLLDGEKVTLDDYPMSLQTYTSTDGTTTYTGYGLYFGEIQPATLGAKLQYSWLNTLDFVRIVRLSLQMMVSGQASLNDVSGPVGIVTTIDSTVEEASPYGIGAVLLMLINFSILLNANLGAVNLLPLPALDGGRLVFLFIELIRGKPIDKEKEGMVHMAGMLFLLALMVLILFNDLRKLF